MAPPRRRHEAGPLRRQQTKALAILQPSSVSQLVAARARGERLTHLQGLFLLLNDVTSSWSASKLGRTSQLLLALYAACLIGKSVTWLTDITGANAWVYIISTFNIIFSLEAAVRVVSYQPRPMAAFRDPFTWVDILTVVPFWARLVVLRNSYGTSYLLRNKGGEQFFRVLEALSTVRLLKLCRYYEAALLLYHAVRDSLSQLFIPMFMLLIMAFVFASIIFEIEWDHSVDACAQVTPRGSRS